MAEQDDKKYVRFKSMPELDMSYIEGPSGIPERKLLLKVLERALLDLKEDAPKDSKKDSLRWFYKGFRNIKNKVPINPNVMEISLKHVVDEMEFTEDQVDHLKYIYLKAKEDYEKKYGR